MRKFWIILFAWLVVLPTTGPVLAWAESYSGQAVLESVQASGHVSASAVYGMVASGQATSAAMAVPLAVGGAVLGSAGAMSTAAAWDSVRAATAPIGTPLVVTEEVMTIVPPNAALQPKEQR